MSCRKRRQRLVDFALSVEKTTDGLFYG